MRRKLLSVIILACVQLVTFAQKVGLGTNTPIAMLDVKGSINSDSLYRILGAVNYVGGIVLSIKGTQNTLVGLRANFSTNTPGHSNTATGFEALALGSSGVGSGPADSNTAIGHRANYFNREGDDNTACGNLALLNDQGSHNTAIGSFAFPGASISFNGKNSAFGYHTIYSIKAGGLHLAMGSHALELTPLGSQDVATRNIAVGYYAMWQDNHDPYGNNIAVGNYALQNGALYSVAIGAFALYNNSNDQFWTGGLNVAIGSQALYGNTYARYNTAAGYAAARTVDLGYNNTVIGAEAEVGYDSMYNGIALGNLAHATNNSVVRIGNSANWSYGGYANWTNISDGRFKKNISENVSGLPFIMRLRPVTYQLKAAELNKSLVSNEPDDKMKLALNEKEQMIWTGFIAQEVDSVAKRLNFNFSGLENPANGQDYYGLRYDEFVVPLIKAIQEQQEILKFLKKELAALKEINQQLLENRK